MFKYFILGLFLLSQLVLQAQENSIKKNTVSLELAGSGLFYSVNYDRLLIIDTKLRLTGNVGVWYLPQIEAFSDFNIIGGVIGFNTLIGKQKHFAELGINVSYLNMIDFEDNMFHTLYLPIRLGYRYQKDDGGVFLRASFMPIISIIQDADAEFLYPVTPHFALGVGYSF